MRPSIYGNPYVIGRDGSREEVLRKFREYFREKIFLSPEFKAAVERLRTASALVCCCAPKPCHADVYADYLERS